MNNNPTTLPAGKSEHLRPRVDYITLRNMEEAHLQDPFSELLRLKDMPPLEEVKMLRPDRDDYTFKHYMSPPAVAARVICRVARACNPGNYDDFVSRITADTEEGASARKVIKSLSAGWGITESDKENGSDWFKRELNIAKPEWELSRTGFPFGLIMAEDARNLEWAEQYSVEAAKLVVHALDLIVNPPETWWQKAKKRLSKVFPFASRG